MQWDLDVARTKEKSLVSLFVPTASLFMWIPCHDTACLGHVNFPNMICSNVEANQLIWDFTDKCSGGQYIVPQREKYHHLHFSSCWQVSSGTGRSLPEAPLPSHPGRKQSPGFSVQADCRLLAVASAHQIQSQDVMRRGALEKLCKDLWPEYSSRGVQNRSGSQAYLETASSWATPHWAVSRDSCLTLAVQGNVLCGHQCFQEENRSNGTEELEWRWAKSQEVTETHLMLLQANSTAC